MKRGIVLWFVVLPLLGCLSYFGSYAVSHLLSTFGSSGGPSIDCPQTLNYGDQEFGQIAVAHFTVANRGRSDLKIDSIRTTCTCAGLEREENGDYTPVRELSHSPGEEVQLTLRISVRSEVGQPSRSYVTFRTNDPRHPEFEIEALVPLVTGVDTFPRTLALGTVSKGSVARSIIEIRDLSGKKRRIHRAFTNNPDRITVCLLPSESTKVGQEKSGKGSLIGLLEVVVTTEAPGAINGAVQVQVDEQGERLVSIPIVGQVVSDVEVSPSTLVLPRKSQEGPLYFGNCRCWSTKGEPILLSEATVPKGISVQVSEVPGNPAMQLVTITCDPSLLNDPTMGAKVVRLNARVKAVETPVEIQIRAQKNR
jgi:hypothetical protein